MEKNDDYERDGFLVLGALLCSLLGDFSGTVVRTDKRQQTTTKRINGSISTPRALDWRGMSED